MKQYFKVYGPSYTLGCILATVFWWAIGGSFFVPSLIMAALSGALTIWARGSE